MSESTEPDPVAPITVGGDVAPAGKRYAAYDNTHLRFVGGVYGKRADVAKDPAVKSAKDSGHDVNVTEV